MLYSSMRSDLSRCYNMMLIQENLSIEEKLRILTDAAKYDVACTSSEVGRKGKEGGLGNSRIDGLCHSFSADGRCISLLKILYTNRCIYDCKYCVNRRSNDTVRTAFTPEEVCTLTMEEIYRALYLLRRVHHFNVLLDPKCDWALRHLELFPILIYGFHMGKGVMDAIQIPAVYALFRLNRAVGNEAHLLTEFLRFS